MASLNGHEAGNSGYSQEEPVATTPPFYLAKEKVYEETKDLSPKEMIAHFKKTSKDIRKKYGLKLRKLHPAKKRGIIGEKGKPGPQFKKDIKESLTSGKPEAVWKEKRKRRAVSKSRHEETS